MDVNKEPQYQGFLEKNKGKWTNRILIFTPMTGVVRAEWVMARYGQIIPTNWSHVDLIQWISSYVPLQYQLADAENLAAKMVVEQNFEWLLTLEHDNVIPPDTFVRLNEYMRKGDIPVIGGVYFTKSVPPEPILYRGRGNSFFRDWKFGDKVWVDGVPFGCTLIHGDIIRALWKEAPEYEITPGQVTRRVFNTPEKSWGDPETQNTMTEAGTSDLAFCTKLMKDGIFEKAGFPKYQKMKYPFLIDTNIFVKHIDFNGQMYPIVVPEEYVGEPGYQAQERGEVDKIIKQPKKHVTKRTRPKRK